MKMNFLSHKNNFSQIVKTSVFSLRVSLMVFACCMLFSCSEDINFNDALIDSSGDYISVDLVIADEEVVSTRADENDINTLTLLVFNKDTKSLVQKEDKNLSDLNPKDQNVYGVKFTKNDDAKAANHLTIYAFANIDWSEVRDKENSNVIDLTSTSFSLDDIDRYVTENLKNTSDYLYMSGHADVTPSTSIELIRTAGKLSMTKADKVTNFTLTEFYVYNPASKAYLTAGITGELYNKNLAEEGSTEFPSTFTGQSENNVLYTLPTITHNGKHDDENAEVLTYIVIHGKYTNAENVESDSYYALPVYSKTDHLHYNILPNHTYEITIEEVNEAGYASPEEAVNNPCDYIIYDIHDHTPTIFSMASDGVHELGVTLNVDLKTQDNGEISDVFTVKWYSARKSEMDDFDKKGYFMTQIAPFITVTNGEDWITIEEPVKQEPTSDTKESDNFGIQYQYTVKLKEARFTPQEGEILVEWKPDGSTTKLWRKIIVRYTPDFNLDKTSTITLLMKDENDELKYTIDDYWKFIRENGSYAREKLYGVSIDDMADGKIRDEGLHFPMPYGKKITDNNTIPTQIWSYEYQINFTPLQNEMEGDGSEGRVSITKVDLYSTTGINKTDLNWSSTGNSGTLKLIGNLGYNYVTGKIVFQITYTKNGESATRNVSMDLYHTGFFHYTGDDSKYLAEVDKGFYYYEVIEMEGKHWLDRNLGAKSNRMCVDTHSSSSITTTPDYGNPEAKGTFLKVSDYKEAQYRDPEVLLDMCPLGYHIPVSSEWNSIRLSDRFITGTELQDNQQFTTTYYNSNHGKVYFPRAKYYNDQLRDNWYELNANNGDASTGYYWTATAAPGMEKLEMGKWLRGLYLNGSNSTYINMNVVESRLLVRCVAGATIPSQDNNYVSLNVHNATHVYLFDIETKSALYNFPGKAVSSAASSQQWQYFSATTSVPMEEIGMLFVKISSDEKVTLYERDGDTFKEVTENYSNIINNPQPSQYWKPPTDSSNDSYYYDFCSVAKNRAGGNVTSEKPSIEKSNQECNAAAEVTGTVQFTKEYNSEVDLGVGQLTLRNMGVGNNQDLANGNYNWSEVPSESTLKIYVEPLDNQNPGIKLFYQGWGWIGEYNYARPFNNNADNQDTKLRIFEIPLPLNILNELVRTGGLIMQGQNLKLRGMTLIKGSGPTVAESGSGGSNWEVVFGNASVPSSSEIRLYTGNFHLNWNDLNITNINQLQEGDKIRIYGYPDEPNPNWWAFDIRQVYNWDNKFVQIDYPNGYAEIVLSNNNINTLKSYGGFMITGEGCTVTYVTIKRD